MANLPADLPTNWTQGQIISPNGTEVGLTEQHGYNYLNEQVNAAQEEVNTLSQEVDALSQEVSGAASQASVDNIAETIGTYGDTSEQETLFGKSQEIIEKIIDQNNLSSCNIIFRGLPGTAYTFTDARYGVFNFSVTLNGDVDDNGLVTEVLSVPKLKYSVKAVYSSNQATTEADFTTEEFGSFIPIDLAFGQSPTIKTTNGNFTFDSDKFYTVLACGGGGGGAGWYTASSNRGRSGGGGGGGAIGYFYVTNGGSISYTLGAGGIHPAEPDDSTQNDGTNGSPTVITGVINVTLPGGGGGKYDVETDGNGGAGGEPGNEYAGRGGDGAYYAGSDSNTPVKPESGGNSKIAGITLAEGGSGGELREARPYGGGGGASLGQGGSHAAEKNSQYGGGGCGMTCGTSSSNDPKRCDGAKGAIFIYEGLKYVFFE